MSWSHHSWRNQRARSRSISLEVERESNITPERLDHLKDVYNKCRTHAQTWWRELSSKAERSLLWPPAILEKLCTAIIDDARTWEEVKSYRHRREEARSRVKSVILDELPRRDQNLLECFWERGLESELGDPVVISESEEEDTTPGNLSGVWANPYPPKVDTTVVARNSSSIIFERKTFEQSRCTEGERGSQATIL